MGIISLDGAAFKSDLQSMLRQMDAYGKAGAAAIDIAIVEYAEKMLNEMKRLAPHKTYALIKSGHVEGPRKEGDWTVVEIVWDVPYANIQDKGGKIFAKNFTAKPVFKRGQFTNKYKNVLGQMITRRQVNTAKLFVPLRPGVRPIQDPVARAAAGYKYGIDFVLTRFVVIDGSKFITMVLDSHRTNSARDIGKRAEVLWDNLAKAGKK